MADQPKFIGGYIVSPARSLLEACRAAQCDDSGRRCPHCPLRDLCQSEARWLVQRSLPPAPLA